MINWCPKLQGSKGDTGLQGPQGPPGVGVAGTSVRHSCMFMLAHPGYGSSGTLETNVLYMLCSAATGKRRTPGFAGTSRK